MMARRPADWAWGCVLLVALWQCSAASGEVRGSDVFQQSCASCHSLTAAVSSLGPPLFDIFGRRAASRSYAYSAALKAKGEAGLVWDQPTLMRWVVKPAELVPGTSMGFAGLPFPEDAGILVAFLKNSGKDPQSGGAP